MTAQSEFKKRLAAAIVSSGVKKGELARRLDVDPARVSEWLREPGKEGSSLPSGEMFIRMPGALGVNGHWLLTGQGDPWASPGDAELLLREVRRLLAAPGDSSQGRDAKLEASETGSEDADRASSKKEP